MKLGTLLVKLNQASSSVNAQVKIAHGTDRQATTVKEVYVRKDGTVVIR